MNGYGERLQVRLRAVGKLGTGVRRAEVEGVERDVGE